MKPEPTNPNRTFAIEGAPREDREKSGDIMELSEQQIERVRVLADLKFAVYRDRCADESELDTEHFEWSGPLPVPVPEPVAVMRGGHQQTYAMVEF